MAVAPLEEAVCISYDYDRARFCRDCRSQIQGDTSRRKCINLAAAFCCLRGDSSRGNSIVFKFLTGQRFQFRARTLLPLETFLNSIEFEFCRNIYNRTDATRYVSFFFLLLTEEIQSRNRVLTLKTFRDNRPNTLPWNSLGNPDSVGLSSFPDRSTLHLLLPRDKLKANVRENRANSKIRVESTLGENSRVTYHAKRGEHRMYNTFGEYLPSFFFQTFVPPQYRYH